MSNSGKFRDPIPHVPTAGISTTIVDESTQNCIQPEQFGLRDAPGTPEGIKKYRKSFQNQPGVKQVHPGMVGDNNRGIKHTYGKPTGGSEHVGHVIKAQNLSGLADYHNDLKEGKYASHVREPLGQSYVRGHQLPPVVEDEKFKFGVPTVGSESAKDVLYPAGGEKEEICADMYKKTHGTFGPGEQKKRGYQWPVAADAHRFGYSEGRVPGGAANSLHPERLGGSFPKTVIV
jgi:hypothetical protein